MDFCAHSSLIVITATSRMYIVRIAVALLDSSKTRSATYYRRIWRLGYPLYTSVSSDACHPSSCATLSPIAIEIPYSARVIVGRLLRVRARIAARLLGVGVSDSCASVLSVAYCQAPRAATRHLLRPTTLHLLSSSPPHYPTTTTTTTFIYPFPLFPSTRDPRSWSAAKPPFFALPGVLPQYAILQGL